MTFLDIALDCLKLGWSVFPCVPADKNPIKGVPGYIAGSNSEDQVRAWWAREPNANPAIATGKSRVDVLDIDKGLTDEASLRAFMAARNLPETYAVRTGSRPAFKVQLYYAHDGEPVKTFNGWEDGAFGGDLRGSTWGHVMAAGSVHPDSKERYEVLWDLPLAPVPDYVRNMRRAERANKALADPNAPIVEWRNDTLYRVLCKHRSNGADDEMLRDFALRAVAKMPNPLDDDELERIIANACKQPVGLPEAEAVLTPVVKATVSVAEDAEEITAKPRPVYAEDVWRDTPYWEFAELCSRDNFVPKKFFIEAIRTVTGAVVGRQLRGDFAGCLPRAFTILISTAGGGKGTACEFVERFFRATWESGDISVEPPLLFNDKHVFWRSRDVGAQVANLASAPALMKALEPRKLKKGEVLDPREVWRPIHRFIGIQEELRGLFANFANESTGDGLEAILCELWDRETFSCTATVNRPPAYGECMYSILGGITPDLWDRVFSKVGATDSGFLSRLNIIGTEEERRVPKLKLPDLTSLRNRFFPLIKDLEKNPRVMSATPEADAVIERWFSGLDLPETVQRSRLNIHAWRTALHLAWLHGHAEITAEDAEGGTRIADYQVAMREHYAPPEGENQQARCEQSIRKVMRARRRIHIPELKRRTNYSRAGVTVWLRAFEGLRKGGEIRQDGDTAILLKRK